jgi:hypothetical protein
MTIRFNAKTQRREGAKDGRYLPRVLAALRLCAFAFKFLQRGVLVLVY